MNREIARDNDSMLFVTAMFGTLMLATGDVTIVDAGHNPAVVVSPGGRLNSPAIPKSVALGVVEDFEFTEGRFHLAPGTTLAALHRRRHRRPQHARAICSATSRLHAAIRHATAGHAPAALVSSITATIDGFAAGAPQEDDITLLAIKRPA